MQSRSHRRLSSIELPKRVRLFAQETDRQSVHDSRVSTMPAIREFTHYADCFKFASTVQRNKKFETSFDHVTGFVSLF